MQTNAEYGCECLVKKSNDKNGGHSALYFMLFGCSDFRQSMDDSFYLKNRLKNGSVQPCVSCFLGARNLGRVLATLHYFVLIVATFFHHSDAPAWKTLRKKYRKKKGALRPVLHMGKRKWSLCLSEFRQSIRAHWMCWFIGCWVCWYIYIYIPRSRKGLVQTQTQT